MTRLDWNTYFMEIAELASHRSTCLRRKVGAIAVRNNRILAVGYNGSPSGTKHCSELGGCIRQQLNIPSGERRELCRAVHAEQNLLIQAAIHGISLEGCDIYCNCSPCSDCFKTMISLKVRNAYFLERYPDELVKAFASEEEVLINMVQITK